MSDVIALQQERTKLFYDVHNSIIPKRVPINIGVSTEIIAEFDGVNLMEAQWNTTVIEEAADKICKTVFTDACPYMGTNRAPALYTPLKSQSFVMGSNGTMQHPEVTGMLVEEYDYLNRESI